MQGQKRRRGVEEVAFTWRSDADGAAHWLSPRKKKPGASADDLSQCLFTFGGRARAGARKAIAKTLISVHMSPEARLVLHCSPVTINYVATSMILTKLFLYFEIWTNHRFKSTIAGLPEKIYIILEKQF
jgi:hypothetical protein